MLYKIQVPTSKNSLLLKKILLDKLSFKFVIVFPLIDETSNTKGLNEK